jgi:hypothetical protein
MNGKLYNAWCWLWFRQETDVHQVVQHITLSSGGNKKVWDATITVINLASEYISCWMHIPMLGIPYNKDIYLQRCAFVKVIYSCSLTWNHLTKFQRNESWKMKEPMLLMAEDPEASLLRPRILELAASFVCRWVVRPHNSVNTCCIKRPTEVEILPSETGPDTVWSR